MNNHTLLALMLALALALPARAHGQAQDTTLTLTEAVASAVATHPTLEGARARLDAAAATTGETRAAWFPTVAASAMTTQHQEPMVVAPLHGFDITDPPQFDATLIQGHASAEFTLFDGSRGGRIRAAQAGEASARAGVATARDAVMAEATAVYLAVLTARDILEANDRRVEALQEEAQRTRLFLEEGTAPRVTSLRAEAALSRARAERETASQQLEVARRRLARVSGLEASRIAVGLAEVSLRAEVLPDRDSLVALAMTGSPGLTQARRQVEAAETGAAAARGTFLPRVSLTGAYSAFTAPGYDVALEWQAGVQVSYPLFTGGARSAGVARAEAQATAARAQARLAEQQVADAVDGALLALRSAAARVAALEAAVAQSDEVVRIEALALESGAGVQTDYLRAVAELTEVRSGLAQARHGEVEARVRLAQATGTLTMDWLEQMTERAEP